MTHTLIVSEYWDEDHSCYGYDYEVQHDPKKCTSTKIYSKIGETDIWDWDCNVARCINWSGFEDLGDDPRMKISGKYEIEFFGYFPTSMYEDAEQYIYFKEPYESV